MIYTRDFIDGGKKPDPLTQFNSSFGEWMLGALHKKQLLRKGNCGIVRILIFLFVPLCVHSAQFFPLSPSRSTTNEWVLVRKVHRKGSNEVKNRN